MSLFFSKKTEDKSAEYKGLYVTVEELIAEQKNLPYLMMQHNKLTSNRSGDVKSAFKGRGMELEEVRAYTFGDDIRDIDWRITARKSEPYTKIYSEEKDRVITVFLDLSATMVFGTRCELKSVCAAKIASLLGWLSIKNKDRFALMLYDGAETVYFKPQSTYQHLMSIFSVISQTTKKILDNPQKGNLASALQKLQYHQKGQGTIFILSDFYHIDNAETEQISILAKRNKLYCFNIFDVIEEVAPTSGEYEARYENQKIIFDSGSAKFKREYQKFFAQNREKIKKSCQKFSCKYVEIRTDVPIFKQLRLM